MKCPCCREDIRPGQAVQRMPAPQRAMLGQKSGALGLYPHEDYSDTEEDIVHYPECCMGYFSPEDNPYIYDEAILPLRDQVEEEVREEIREEFEQKFERVKEMIRQEDYEFCVNCWTELEGEEPNPMCLWCKRTEDVWTKSTSSGTVHFCARCQKMWNEDEEEMVAA